MRTLGTFLAVGTLALTVGCGGSGSPSLDGGGAGGISGNGGALGGYGGVFGGNGGESGGVGGVFGGVGGAAGGSSGTCKYPSCIASLGTTCDPSGACVEQTDATTGASNTCYSNGVKVMTTFNLTSGAGVSTIKNASGTCYTMNLAFSPTGSSTTLTIKNASGQTVATGTVVVAGATSTTTITCTGGQPVTLDPSCDTGMNSTCATGTCTP